MLASTKTPSKLTPCFYSRYKKCNIGYILMVHPFFGGVGGPSGKDW